MTFKGVPMSLMQVEAPHESDNGVTPPERTGTREIRHECQ